MLLTGTTEPFRIAPSTYLRIATGQLMPRLLSALALPLIGCMIGACFDLRWAFVGLIMLFIMAPLVIAYVYYTRLLTVEAQRAVCPKQVTLTDSEIIITYLSASDEHIPPAPQRFPRCAEKEEVWNGYLVVALPEPGHPLILPLSAVKKGERTSRSESGEVSADAFEK